MPPKNYKQAYQRERIARQEAERLLTEKTRELYDNVVLLEGTLHELKRSQTKLIHAEKMSALTGMVVGIAHELNTPLGISVTSLSLLREQFTVLEKKFTDQTITPGDLARFLEVSGDCIKMTSDNIERSVSLVNKLKQVDKKMSIEQPSNINLKVLLEDSVTLLTAILSEKAIEVNVHCDDSLELWVPKMSLQYVIEELINNCALHAFQSHGNKNNYTITIKVQVIDHHTEIIIEDNGVGISPDDLNKVFQPFYTTLRSRGGTGLGMYMVYNICTRKLAGGVNVKSEVGKGTQITLMIGQEADH
ncbi:sensor histidine kinase [Vibrio caribbeanicus]|uniref:histidine kinase n=1 Tax=Vibrio caribbeanicus ATCC BAA-2122 TaxID=796620 RepID=E3BN20_9VIBR|nr:HAMP domain-containing sensor histidine kinase [Vibrio caribbeanicus]EFP95646.1 Signal transduction histidine kinase [Vibrio caribbeanicus ATCC BAA-2122]